MDHTKHSKFMYVPNKNNKVVKKTVPVVDEDDEPIEEGGEMEEGEIQEEEIEEEEEVVEKPRPKTPKRKMDPTENPVEGRYRWLTRQMSKRPLPVRPIREEIQHHHFLWVSTSSDLKKNVFSYGGENYTNPTVPLRKIYEAEGIDFKPTNIKGWDQLEVLAKKKLTDTKPDWVALNKAIPPEFRRNKKVDEVEEPTPKKKKPIQPKKAKKEIVEETEEQEEEIEQEEEDAVEQEDAIELAEQIGKPKLNIGVRNLDTNKVLDFERKVQNITIPSEDHYTTLGLALNRAATRAVMSFNVNQTVQIIKHINVILGDRDERIPVGEHATGQQQTNTEPQTPITSQITEVNEPHPEVEHPAVEPEQSQEPSQEPSQDTGQDQQTNDTPQQENQTAEVEQFVTSAITV